MAQTSACNCHHALEQQLCRWLLLDRLPGNDMQVTHERMAVLLGVRREGVTDGAIKLQTASRPWPRQPCSTAPYWPASTATRQPVMV